MAAVPMETQFRAMSAIACNGISNFLSLFSFKLLVKCIGVLQYVGHAYVEVHSCMHGACRLLTSILCTNKQWLYQSNMRIVCDLSFSVIMIMEL